MPMSGESATAPVIAGLGVGIAFLVLISAFFGQSVGLLMQDEYRPRPGRIAGQAIEIAMQDNTLQQLFKEREIVVTYVRDWGVSGGPDCPIGWCAFVLLDDKSDNASGLALAAVNVKTGKVTDISIHRDILIERANVTEEVQHFLSKYPDSEVDVLRRGTEATVTYSASKLVEADQSVFVERKRVLAVIYDKSDDILMENVVDMKIYCLPGTLSIAALARGDSMIGRIDNEGCFGMG